MVGNEQTDAQQARVETLLPALMRFSLVALGLLLCVRVFAPFAPIMLWALVLAVALQPAADWLRRRLGCSASRAATLIVVLALLLIGVPVVTLAMSFAERVTDFVEAYRSGAWVLPAPSQSVADWPIVGERVFALWSEAAANLPETLQTHQEGLKTVMRTLLSIAGSAAGTVALFLGAIIVAGIMMAHAQSATVAMTRIACALTGDDRGAPLLNLSIATTRSVATGVVGIAFLQAILLGIGFMIVGIPLAGVLAILIMVISIVQLPALLVTLPIILWLWMTGDGGVLFNTIMTVFFVLGGVADGLMKPVLLGRGVDVPMPVVLIGAIGGVVALGLIGLFLGAVLLSLGYSLFMAWVDQETAATAPSSAD